MRRAAAQRRVGAVALAAWAAAALYAAVIEPAAALAPGWGPRGRVVDGRSFDLASIQPALQFLSQNMPKQDIHVVSDHDLVHTAVRALRARKATKWARAVPQHVWLEAVLPYRHLDEPYEDWRPRFAAALGPLVANASSTTEAAQVRTRARARSGAAPRVLRFTLQQETPSNTPPPLTPTYTYTQIINREVWGLLHSPPIYFKPDQAPEIMAPSQVGLTFNLMQRSLNSATPSELQCSEHARMLRQAPASAPHAVHARMHTNATQPKHRCSRRATPPAAGCPSSWPAPAAPSACPRASRVRQGSQLRWHTAAELLRHLAGCWAVETHTTPPTTHTQHATQHDRHA